MIWPKAGLVFGIAMTAANLYGFPSEGRYRGFIVPTFGVAIQIVVGLCITAISLRALLRGEGKPRPYTDEDVEKSKRILEQMHMRDHGAPPEYPGEDDSKQ